MSFLLGRASRYLRSVKPWMQSQVLAIHTSPPQRDVIRKKANAFAGVVSTVGNHFTFFPSDNQDSISKANSTLVVLCGWLGASDQHLMKYVQLWNKREVDVLWITTRWIELLTPELTHVRNAPKVARGLLEARSMYPNILFHTLSAGGYSYASIVKVILEDPSLTELRPHLKGVILDSLANWPYILSSKIALSELLHPRLLELMPTDKLKEMLEAPDDCPPSIRVSPGNIQFFVERNQIIYDNPLKIPGLVLFSRADPLLNLSIMHRMVENWYRLGIPVVSQMWTDAPHVQMYRLYPEEYTGLLDAFVCQTTDWCYHFEGKSGQKPKAHA